MADPYAIFLDVAPAPYEFKLLTLATAMFDSVFSNPFMHIAAAGCRSSRRCRALQRGPQWAARPVQCWALAGLAVAVLAKPVIKGIILVVVFLMMIFSSIPSMFFEEPVDTADNTGTAGGLSAV